jgi:hypothetical protein
MPQATSRADRDLAVALRRLEHLQRVEALDPLFPESRPTPGQDEVLRDFGRVKQQYVRAGNQSGKSAVCARNVAWFLTGEHPHWSRPAAWGDEALLVIIAGRTGKQIEESLWPKVRNCLDEGSYREIRLGNILQRVELSNGNRIVFQSLENPQTAQLRLQSYVAHLVWIDELPPTMGILRELMIRVQAKDGYLLASFTPTVRSIEIQQYVDGLQLPEGKVYRFRMLDNPLYADPVRKQELLQRYSHLPKHIQAVILDGDWMASDDAVYHFSPETMIRYPAGYSPQWRHVLAVDPALSSALGLILLAEQPTTGHWYVVLAEYLRGIRVPTDLVAAVEGRVRNHNVVRRVSDPHEVWYISTAAAMPGKYTYQGVYKKSERKPELIKSLQEALGHRLFLAPGEATSDLVTEFQECTVGPDGKIVGASRYHLLDALQYGLDSLPKSEITRTYSSHDQWLYEANEKRKVAEQKQIQKSQRRGRIQQRRRTN